MHPVGDTGFSDGGHEDMAEQNNGNACRACHGLNGEGSVLARAATARVLQNEGKTVSLSKGEIVTCTLCHDNELN
jgi:cytochrome c553